MPFSLSEDARAVWRSLSGLEQTRVELAVNRVSLAKALSLEGSPFVTATHDILIEGRVGAGGVSVSVDAIRKASPDSAEGKSGRRASGRDLEFSPEAEEVFLSLSPADRSGLRRAIERALAEGVAVPGSSIIVAAARHVASARVSQDGRQCIVDSVTRAARSPNEP